MNLSQQDALRLLDEAGVIRQGHFIGQMGGHLSTYLDKDQASAKPRVLRQLASGLAFFIKYRLGNLSDVVVVGAPMGALGLAIMVAEELDCEYCFLDKPEFDHPRKVQAKRALTRKMLNGRRIVLVEDILTTGDTAKDGVIEITTEGGTVLTVACLANRGQVTSEAIGAPMIIALVDKTLPNFSEGECRAHGMCAAGVPINLSPGHGSDLRAKGYESPGGWID